MIDKASYAFTTFKLGLLGGLGAAGATLFRGLPRVGGSGQDVALFAAALAAIVVGAPIAVMALALTPRMAWNRIRYGQWFRDFRSHR